MKPIALAALAILLVLLPQDLQAAFGSQIGILNNVPAYSNEGNEVTDYYGYSTIPGTQELLGLKWHCVEYVNRYYYNFYNKKIRGTGGHAYTYYGTAADRGLKAYPNQSSTQPKQGDILCFSGGPGGYGHVAIVDYISGSRIYVCQQNVSRTTAYGSYPITLINGIYTVSGGTLNCQGWLRLATPLPWGMNEPFVESSRVGVDWADVAGANAYRLQIARSGVAWTKENGFLPSSSPANSNVPVNAGIPIPGGGSSYIWQSGSAYAPYASPIPGQTYRWTVRVNVPATGASFYTSPRSFTVPTTPVAAISLSTTSLYATSSAGINAPASSFTIRNSGGGTLSYSISDNASWISLSPPSGTSSGETDVIQVNYNSSSLAPGSYAATITVSGSGISSRNISVNLTVASATDDYGNTLATAYRTYPGYSHPGTIEVSGDCDMFIITLTSSGNSLRVYTTGTTDTYGELLDSSGSVIATNDDSNGTTNFEVYVTGLPAATYYLKVRGYNTHTGAYQVYFSNASNPFGR